jgi:Domain of unknown function (DUF4190)/Septum formation
MSDPYAQPTAPPPEPVGLPGYYLPPPERGTNGFAIAALVFGIIGLVLFAVVFGIIALVQIPKKGQRGKGMAIAGLALAAVWALLIGAFVVSAVTTSAGRGAGTGEITEAGEVSTARLRVGDCVNDLEESEAVTSLPAVPCDDPHDGEVFAVFDLPDGDYPPEKELFAAAESRCEEELMEYAPQAMNSSIGLFYFYPHESAWPDDREIVCIATAMSGTMTGSIADS